MANATSTDLVPIKLDGIEVTDSEVLVKAVFEGSDVELVDDPVEAQKEILRRILSAETPDELLNVAGAQSWSDLLGVPIEVHEVSLRRSAYDEGSRVYAIVAGTRMDDGSAVTLSIGGVNVLGQLMQAARKGWLPMTFALRRADKPTAAGFYPLWLGSP